MTQRTIALDNGKIIISGCNRPTTVYERKDGSQYIRSRWGRINLDDIVYLYSPLETGHPFGKKYDGHMNFCSSSGILTSEYDGETLKLWYYYYTTSAD